MKKENVWKPLTNNQFEQVKNKHALVDLFLATGARIAEVNYLINNWKNEDAIAIPKKGTGGTKCIIYLSKYAMELLPKVQASYKGYTEKTIYLKVCEFGENFGLDIHPHMLRATFASQLIQNGVDLVRIQTLMNHSDISTTSKYIVFDERNLRAATECMFNPDYHLDGMTIDELKQEVIKLRVRLNRKENK